MANVGLLPVKSLSDIEKEEKDIEKKNKEAEDGGEDEVFERGFVGYLQRLWSKAKDNKRHVESRMLSNLRARRGIYEPEDLAALRSLYGSDYNPVYPMITETKCRNGESWVREVFFQKGERPWDIGRTPIPDLPDAVEDQVRLEVSTRVSIRVMQAEVENGMVVLPEQIAAMIEEVMPIAKEVAKRTLEKMADKSAEKMAETIEDQFLRGMWAEALDECITDVITHGTMIMTGPIVTKNKVRRRVYDPVVGGWKTVVEDEYRESFYRRSPFDIYPLPGVTDFQNGDFFDRCKYTRSQMADLLTADEGGGYDKDSIKEVIKRASESTYKTKSDLTGIDSERATLEGRDSMEIHNTDFIEVLKFHGSVPGRMLKEKGMKDVEDDMEYDIVAMVATDGWELIRLIINPDRTNKRPYFKAGFSKVPDAFFWRGVPELCEPAQRMGGAACRNIIMNTSFSSGPQVEVNVERLAPGADSALYPFKVWQATTSQMSEGQAVNFYMPPNVATKLMETYEFSLRMADDDTGIPRIAYGNTRSMGANETASGLSMMLSQAAKGIKAVVKYIDDGVIKPSVTAMYDYNMMYTDDPDLIGDLRVVARGSYALMAREQQAVRRTEFLSQTANPFDMEIIGKRGRAELLRQALKALEIDADEIIPSKDEIDALAPKPQFGPQNDAGQSAGAQDQPIVPTPQGLTEGAPPPAMKQLGPGGVQPAGRENQLFESRPGVTP